MGDSLPHSRRLVAGEVGIRRQGADSAAQICTGGKTNSRWLQVPDLNLHFDLQKRMITANSLLRYQFNQSLSIILARFCGFFFHNILLFDFARKFLICPVDAARGRNMNATCGGCEHALPRRPAILFTYTCRRFYIPGCRGLFD